MSPEEVAQRLRRARYVTSATNVQQLPADTGAEIAFAGRSNAGKSSAINSLCGQRTLAKASKTPGRTRMINFFEVDAETRLVDLPGHGYAEVPLAVRVSWEKMLHGYLSKRTSLKGIVYLTDIRRPLTDVDWSALNLYARAKVPVVLLLNKADKLSQSAGQAALRGALKVLSEIEFEPTLILFSSKSGVGKQMVFDVLGAALWPDPTLSPATEDTE